MQMKAEHNKLHSRRLFGPSNYYETMRTLEKMCLKRFCLLREKRPKKSVCKLAFPPVSFKCILDIQMPQIIVGLTRRHNCRGPNVCTQRRLASPDFYRTTVSTFYMKPYLITLGSELLNQFNVYWRKYKPTHILCSVQIREHFNVTESKCLEELDYLEKNSYDVSPVPETLQGWGAPPGLSGNSGNIKRGDYDAIQGSIGLQKSAIARFK